MPTVAYVFEYPTLSGGEQSILAMLPFVREAGLEPVALAPRAGALADRLHGLGVTVVPFDDAGAAGARRQDLATRRAGLDSVLSHVGPDLVHANSLSMTRLSGPVVAARGVPSVGHIRDILKLSAAVIDDCNRHRRLLAVSEATRRFHVDQGLDPSRVEVLHNGVDLERFRAGRRGVVHAEFGIPAAAPLVVNIGQLGMRKGTDIFVEAARRCVETMAAGGGDVPLPYFLVVGERFSRKDEAVRYEEALHEAASSGPYADHFRFLGWRDDVPTLLAESALLVHAARQEPLGRVLLEAAAAGTAVVATDVGGTSEIFPEEGQAFLVPVDDAAAMAAAMAALLTDPDLRIRTGGAAAARAIAAFDAAGAGRRLADIYLSLL